MDDAPESRSWYRLHWLTWVILLVVGGSFVVENLAGIEKPPDLYIFEFIADPYGYPTYDEAYSVQHGWPMVCILRDRFFMNQAGGVSSSSRWPFDDAKMISFIFLYLGFNILIALTILASTAFTTESYFHRQSKWHQFSIQSVILLTIFVALLLTIAKYDLIRWRGDSIWEYITFFFIAVGLWCVFWTGWRLVAVGVSRMTEVVEEGVKDG